jgi:hypothetical protein
METCVLYIGAKCEGSVDCDFSLKIATKHDTAQEILIGVPITDSVGENSMNYYYIPIEENLGKPVYIVLSSTQGDADLFVTMQPNSNLVRKEDWTLPTAQTYDFKSALTVKQDVVYIEASEIEKCLNLAKSQAIFKEIGDEPECSIVMGVSGAERLSTFDLVSYVNI